MNRQTCDMTVGPIGILEKEDETVYTAPLTGKTDEGDFKLVVKARSRGALEELGIAEVGNKVTIEISPTNSQLTDFGAD